MQRFFKKYLIVLTASILVAAPVVNADSYPEKTITIINPYAPGGNADLQARFIAEFMEQDLGVTVNVENRAGGAGAIGMNFIKASKPNGYTIGITAIGPAVVTPNRTNTGYDSTVDYFPVAQISNSPYTLSVNKSSDIVDVAGLLDKAKEGNGLTYGTTGAGLHTHLMFENFFKKQDATMRHIPSKGAAGTKNALLGGHVDAGALTLPDVVPYYQSGDFKILGIATEERIADLPDVPTFKEQGYDLVTGAWFGFLAPKDTPEEIIAVLEKSVESALKSEKVSGEFADLGINVDFKGNKEFRELIEKDDEVIKAIISE